MVKKDKGEKQPLIEKDDDKNSQDSGPDFIEENYVEFKTKNKGFWTWFLIFMVFISIVLIALSIYTINLENAVDCGGLTFVLYGMIIFHFINMFVALIALVGCELKVCTNNTCCFYVLYVALNIVGIQVGYFNAQS